MKIYIVWMHRGSVDAFRALVFATDMDHAKEVAELRFDGFRCVLARRASRSV